MTLVLEGSIEAISNYDPAVPKVWASGGFGNKVN